MRGRVRNEVCSETNDIVDYVLLTPSSVSNVEATLIRTMLACGRLSLTFDLSPFQIKRRSRALTINAGN